MKLPENLFPRASSSDSGSESDWRGLPSPVLTYSSGSTTPTAESVCSRKQRASLPKLLGIGRVPGKLEDVIYGSLAPTPTQAQIVTAYVSDARYSDCKVLYEIKGPTPAKPLRFVGLKWAMKVQSGTFGAVARHRDLVYLESIGIMTRALASVALNQIAAHHRKMGWEVTKRMRDPNAPTTPPLSTASHTSCSGCAKIFSRLSRTLTCVFCWSRVCARCCEQRELTIPTAIPSPRGAKLVKRTVVNTCTNCYSNVFRHQSAEEVARQEILAREYGSIPAASESALRAKRAQSVPANVMNSRRRRPASAAAAIGGNSQARQGRRGPRAYSADVASSAADSLSAEDLHALVQKLALRSLQTTGNAEPEEPVEEIGGDLLTNSVIEVRRDDGEWVQEAHPSPRVLPAETPAPVEPTDDLYKRIANLQKAAEHLYHSTKRETDNVLGGRAAMPTR
ncbi:hypothetical protein PybrP1_000377 [[Pythium] brassicae (nom. inval.)]|nr:hypothetical protein PybrP1_000377 [[Pythium] brassicae (nom. inval.)]